jgi:hypothetical protein
MTKPNVLLMSFLLLVSCADSVLTIQDEGGQKTFCSDNEEKATVSSELTSRNAVTLLPAPGTLVTPAEGFASYDVSIDNTVNCGGLVLREGPQAFANYLRPLGIIGKSYQACQDGFHPIGQALDVYLNGSTVAGLRPFADWITANGGEMANRLGIVQVIFNRRIWRSYNNGPGRIQGAWGSYGGNDPHTGHIHISFSEAGATGSTSFFSEVIDGRIPQPPMPPAPTLSQQVAATFPSFTVSATGLRLSSVGANRLLDTRNTSPIEPGVVTRAFVSSQVAGATAVSLGVTLINPSGDTFLSVAGGTNAVSTSSVNAKANTVRANQTLVSLTSGVASMRTTQRAHVIIDEQARFSANGSAGFTALGPTRLLDTRNGQSLAAGEVRTVSLAALGVPATAVAAQLGLVAIPRGQPGFISVIPCGEGVSTSAVNFDGVQIASSSALGAVRNGNICIFSNVAADVIVDVAGYFAAGGASLSLTEPARILDTRSGEGGWLGMAGAGQVLRIELSSMPGWQGSSAVAFNLTSTDGREQNFVRVWDCAGDPQHSNLNGTPGTAVATFGVVRSAGSLCVMSTAPQHLILDLVGVYR